VEAQDKAGTDVAAAVVTALSGGLVRSAVNIDIGSEVPDELLPFLPLAEHLGSMLVGLARGLPGRLTVRVEGQLAAYSCRPLVLATIKGALGAVSDAPVTFVNAPMLAEHHGLRVTEEKTSEVGDYATVVRIGGEVDGIDYSVSGSIIGRKGPVFVEVLDHEIELPVSPFTLVLENADVPGVIGRVGSLLGDFGVNIADMVVGKSRTNGDSALMGLSLERALSDMEMEGVRDLEGVRRAWFVDLP
jgi:D-3-phosphoglycerate dehydrogenase